MEDKFFIELNNEEKQTAFKRSISKINRILYVYEQSLINDEFHYRSYVYSVIMYLSSVNSLTNGMLTDAIVNLNSLLIYENLEKEDIRKIVLDTSNYIKKINK